MDIEIKKQTSLGHPSVANSFVCTNLNRNPFIMTFLRGINCCKLLIRKETRIYIGGGGTPWGKKTLNAKEAAREGCLFR
jgi:hypothetical protein